MHYDLPSPSNEVAYLLLTATSEFAKGIVEMETGKKPAERFLMSKMETSKKPAEPPTHPYDPLDPDQPGNEPLPIPPDGEPPAPIPGREPNTDQPIGDPPNDQPTRLASPAKLRFTSTRLLY